MVIPSLSLLMAFAAGFVSGLLWQRTKLISVLIFIFFILLSAGLVTISFQVNDL